MARLKGSKNKKKAVKVIKKPEIQEKKPEIQPEVIEKPLPEIKDTSGLEDRPYFSLDEVARHLGVQERDALLWFNHGHLKGIDDRGLRRVSRASIIQFKKGRLYKMVSERMG